MLADHRPLPSDDLCLFCDNPLEKGTPAFTGWGECEEAVVICEHCVNTMASMLDSGPVSELRDFALSLSIDYKQLADSGDAGFWLAEENRDYLAVVSALDALNALQEVSTRKEVSTNG